MNLPALRPFFWAHAQRQSLPGRGRPFEAVKLTTPYAAMLPPLTTEEKECLADDIKANGVRVPVEITEDGVVLDGHHRLAVDPKAPVIVVKGLSEPQRRAWAIRANLNRRNLSAEQKKALRKIKQKLARELRKTMSEKEVGQALGVPRETVRNWLAIISDGHLATAYNLDPRIKIPAKAREIIARRMVRGETQEQVAADWGVSQPRIAQIVKAEAQQAEKKAAVEAAAKKIESVSGLYHGDFRKLSDKIEDESVDLIFSDPPYGQEAVGLYGDLARFAVAKLKPGGWCLAYSGQSFLPNVYAAMAVNGLTYGWTFAIFHSGGDTRFRKFNLQTAWKPLLGYFKPPLNVWWNWFKDTTSGGREKSDHEWQQAKSEADHFITHLTPKGGMICDPMAGSGTTLAAAKENGFAYCGFEVDKKHFETALARLAQ